ncbi:MAG: hypothetical protein DSY66_03020 [Persephonella sp.]|nr:MAG: hypothetical protein DSY53_02580 [Persephonella sp.]RUM61049.1 MAG: hypothetical protein DSY66_03020 [Persephonella sp.]
MYIGININGDKSYSVSVLDKDCKLVYVSSFLKEGLYWFLEHFKSKRVVFNINFLNKNNLPLILKEYKHLYSVLIENFEFEEFKEKGINGKVILLTDTDRYFSQFVRKGLLPIYTREGLEQRIYNLKKTGLIIDFSYLSKDRKKLKNEINAIVSAYSSYLIDKNLFKFEKVNNFNLLVPVYKFVPKSLRNKEK